MSAYLNSLGIAPEHHDRARHGIATARGLGYSQAEIERLVGIFVELGDSRNFENDFLSRARHEGIDPTFVDLSLSWVGQINSGEIDTSPEANPEPVVMQSGKDDAERAAEIRTMIQKEPHKYFGSPRIQDEFAAILQRAERGESVIQAPDPARDAERKEQLTEMMKQGRSGEYWTGPKAEMRQIEYREILEREGPTQSQVNDTYETH